MKKYKLFLLLSLFFLLTGCSYSFEIETDNNFRLVTDDIYFIGDGAGKAGNIVTAAATGLVAARDIINKSK